MTQPAQGKGDVVQLLELPVELDFACKYCGKPCKLYPKSKAVLHAVPGCWGWSAMKGDQEALGVFLINSGVPVTGAPAPTLR